MRKRLAAAFAVATAGSMLMLSAPADAAQGVTFTLTAGSLTISDPANTALGSVATGTATITSALGGVTVSDGRGALGGTWTASVASTDFTTGAASAEETIAKAQVDYWSGLATGTTGTAVRVPGQLTVLNKQDMSVSRTAYSASATVGNNTTTWNPTLVVNIPAQAVTGTYSGTVTHSVTGA
jgi:hypothetical protein